MSRSVKMSLALNPWGSGILKYSNKDRYITVGPKVNDQKYRGITWQCHGIQGSFKQKPVFSGVKY